MSSQGWQQTLVTSQADGTAVTNSTAATSIIPTGAKYVLPANFFQIGTALRISSRGRISTLATSPGTVTFDIRLGSTVVWTSGAVSLNTSAQTNDSWEFEVILTCRAIGQTTSANLIGVGSFISGAVVGSSGSGIALCAMLPATAPAVGSGFDSTVTNALDHFVTFSTASTSNSITCHEYVVEALN